MKTEWAHRSACQYHHLTSPTATRAPASSVPMIGGEDTVPDMALPSPHMLPGAGYMGLYRSPPAASGQCTCPQVPFQNTILHSILIGQGHKYGYAVSHPGQLDHGYQGCQGFPLFRDGLQGMEEEQQPQRKFLGVVGNDLMLNLY